MSLGVQRTIEGVTDSLLSSLKGTRGTSRTKRKDGGGSGRRKDEDGMAGVARSKEERGKAASHLRERDTQENRDWDNRRSNFIHTTDLFFRVRHNSYSHSDNSDTPLT